MTGSGSPDDSYAIQHEAEYVPIDVLGDQQIDIQDEGKKAVLLCQASRPLGNPYLDVTHLLFVVHGALRNSNVYFSHAMRAAELSGAEANTLIVAPQFIADVDATPERPLPPGAAYWDVESWKGGSPAIEPAPVSSLAREAGIAASSRLITLPEIGHNAEDVLSAKPTRDILFS